MLKAILEIVVCIGVTVFITVFAFGSVYLVYEEKKEKKARKEEEEKDVC